jgi:hypothetical protein
VTHEGSGFKGFKGFKRFTRFKGFRFREVQGFKGLPPTKI